jgi:hypothetical protein
MKTITDEEKVETNWPQIAWKLMRQCEFAISRLKADGWTGELMDTSGAEYTTRHWKEEMADAMELIPGLKVDREAMHAMSMPKKARDKWIADRKSKLEATKP